jgi:hypothetical protein
MRTFTSVENKANFNIHRSQFSDSKNLLALFAILHMSLSLFMGLIGLSPIAGDLHSSQGIWNFAIDSNYYQFNILHLCDVLQSHGWKAWAADPRWLHEKLYSIPYFFLGKSIISATLINTPIYILMLWLIYKIAECLFDSIVARLSICTVALFPSFVLQSTQLLRDSFLIPAELAFLYGGILLLKESGSAKQLIAGFLWSLGGYFGIWVFKDYALPFYRLIEFIIFLSSFWVWIRKGQVYARHPLIILALLITFFTLNSQLVNRTSRISPAVSSKEILNSIPQSLLKSSVPFPVILCKPESMPSSRPPTPSPSKAAPAIPRLISARWSKIFGGVSSSVNRQSDLLAFKRDGFRVGYPTSLTNIDTDVYFRSPWDIVRYVPRALFIGMAAPFPAMWIQKGAQTGRIGRIVSGFEMIFMYVALVLTGICLHEERSNAILWPFALFIILGILLNALVITNIGCLYRFRYIYWFIIVIFSMRTVSRHDLLSFITGPIKRNVFETH